jgi:hypothetical protein
MVDGVSELVDVVPTEVYILGPNIEDIIHSAVMFGMLPRVKGADPVEKLD